MKKKTTDEKIREKMPVYYIESKEDCEEKHNLMLTGFFQREDTFVPFVETFSHKKEVKFCEILDIKTRDIMSRMMSPRQSCCLGQITLWEKTGKPFPVWVAKIEGVDINVKGDADSGK